MAHDHNTFTEQDREIREEMAAFFPDLIFDAHAHIWREQDLGSVGVSPIGKALDPILDHSFEVWKAAQHQLFGKPVQGGLLFPYFVKTTDLDQVNQYLSDQLANEPGSKGLMAVSPGYTDAQIEHFLQDKQIVGFKPYHIFSPLPITFDSEVVDFIPERYWKIADKHGLCIMLHIVKHLSMSDPENQRQLRDLCTRYPGAKLILAHAARSFHAPHAKAVSSLKGLDNVYFDMSAICEAEAIIPIIQQFGPEKLMWGSDYPVNIFRGKCVTVGNGFYWMQKESVDWNNAQMRTEPTLVGLESLRALKSAMELTGLSRPEIENVFYHNAIRMIG